VRYQKIADGFWLLPNVSSFSVYPSVSVLLFCFENLFTEIVEITLLYFVLEF